MVEIVHVDLEGRKHYRCFWPGNHEILSTTTILSCRLTDNSNLHDGCRKFGGNYLRIYLQHQRSTQL